MDIARPPEVARGAAARLVDRVRLRPISLQPNSTSSPPDKNRGIFLSTISLSRIKDSSKNEAAPQRPQARSLLTCMLQLPPELQISILSYLSFGDIERLRRTCRLLRLAINKPLIRSLFPDFKEELLMTCYLCLTKQLDLTGVVRAEETDARYPLGSRCFDCIARRNGFMVGRKYLLGNRESVWVCRWCGLPVARQPAWNQPQFHARCYLKYNRVTVLYFLVGCAQWTIVIVGSALCWRFFRDDRMIWGPTVASFILALFVFCLSIMRGHSTRTYHLALFLELAILSLWIPPVYAIARHVLPQPGEPTGATKATLFFIAANMIFRLFNCLGNLILFCEWQMWRRNKPNNTLLQRVINKTMLILVFWADPQSLEQEYPPSWWVRRRVPEVEAV